MIEAQVSQAVSKAFSNLTRSSNNQFPNGSANGLSSDSSQDHTQKTSSDQTVVDSLRLNEGNFPKSNFSAKVKSSLNKFPPKANFPKNTTFRQGHFVLAQGSVRSVRNSSGSYLKGPAFAESVIQYPSKIFSIDEILKLDDVAQDTDFIFLNPKSGVPGDLKWDSANQISARSNIQKAFQGVSRVQKLNFLSNYKATLKLENKLNSDDIISILSGVLKDHNIIPSSDLRPDIFFNDIPEYIVNDSRSGDQKDNILFHLNKDNPELSPLINSSHISLKEPFRNKSDESLFNVRASVSPKFFAALHSLSFKIYIGEQIQLRDGTNVPKCRKCAQFGCHSRICNRPTCCGHCGSTEHTVDNCALYHSDGKPEGYCKICELAGNDPKHSGMNFSACGMYMTRLKNKYAKTIFFPDQLSKS